MRLDKLPAVWLDGDLRVAVAGTRRARRRGLAGLRAIDPADALFLPLCRSIHTFGMRFAIDVVFLNSHGEVLRLVSAVPPRRLLICRGAGATLETAADQAWRFLPVPTSLFDSQAIE